MATLAGMDAGMGRPDGRPAPPQLTKNYGLVMTARSTVCLELNFCLFGPSFIRN